MQGQRFVVLASDPDSGYPFYVVNQQIYHAGDLQSLGEYDPDERSLDYNVEVTPEWVRQFRTSPLYLRFEDGAAILDSRPVRIVWTDVEDPNARPILGTHDIRLPDLSRPGLVPLNLPEFDPEIRAVAQQLGAPYNPSPAPGMPQMPTIGAVRAPRSPRSPGSPPGRYSPPRSPGSPAQSPRREIPSPQESLVLEALVARLYGLPVTPPQTLIVNGLPVPLIPFTEAVQMLQRNEVERYTIDPLNQVWAGPPGTVNRIVTLIRRDGTLSAVLARYDSNTGQIYPPN